MAAKKQQETENAQRERRLRDGIDAIADRATLDFDAEPLGNVWLFGLASQPVAADALEGVLADAGWHVARLARRDGGKLSKSSTVGLYWLASRRLESAALVKLAKDRDALDAAFASGDVGGVFVLASARFDYADYLVYEIDEDGRDETLAKMRERLPAPVVDFVLGARTRYELIDIDGDRAFAQTLLRLLGTICGGVAMSNDDERFRVVAIV